ncbi:MAG: transcription elongation factor GreA [Anaerolineales bacterium]|nr:transcription elongation factor GreA [Anaerolineales bacterium]
MKEKVIFITQDMQKKLEEKLEYLRTVKRQEVAQLLHDALDEGDEIDDNAAYEIAKNEQAFLEGKIRDLELKLAQARLVEPSGSPDKVQIGSKVIIMGEDGVSETFTIVGSEESNPRIGLISYESPIGKAILDHQAGDEVHANTPIGTLRYKIIHVE